MKFLMVATDFSKRSDRAVRRATMLARQHNAKLKIVHVVDDDRAQKLIDVDRNTAKSALDEIAATVSSSDDVDCDAEVLFGPADQGVIAAADACNADLVVVGPHRRGILRDMFIGTTAERIIRKSLRPVLMANGIPAGPYSNVVLAVDMSPNAAKAVKAAQDLGLLDGIRTGVVHGFVAPSYRMMIRVSATPEELIEYVEGERQQAILDLHTWLDELGFAPNSQTVERTEMSTASLILDCAKVKKAELIVIGAQGRSAIEKLFLGSVAEDVLRSAEVDVLTVGNRQN